ncbi:MAG: glycosyltransferase family 2 protein [Planctomycetaceae bacterium]|nr:glycosyltransferase family 2 protein [Planctomycetaceae bacterium]
MQQTNSQSEIQAAPFSAAVICYNEEEYIGQCLESLSWCEQVVLVDSGSQDNTLEIAAKFPNVSIHSRPFDNFINQKNHALSLCNNEWIVSLDADEVLVPELIEEINQLDLNKAGYRISRRTFIGSQEIKHGNWSPDFQLRLFRKSLAQWGGTNPHETILIEGDIGKLEARMLHYSYHTQQEFVERNTKYVHMMVDHLSGKGRTTNVAEPYVHCVGNFLKAYVLRAGFLDGSAGFFLARHIAGGSYLKYKLLAEKTRQSKAA